MSTNWPEEFVFESELYMIPEYELNMAEEFLEHYVAAIRIFVAQGDAVDWWRTRMAKRRSSLCRA